jgi:hypothetical protein
MKQKKGKSSKTYPAGNPYRTKPDVGGDGGMFSMNPRNWFGKKAAPMDFEMRGKPAYDDGRKGE